MSVHVREVEIDRRTTPPPRSPLDPGLVSVRRLDCPGSDDDTKGYVHVHQAYRYANRRAERRRAARRPMPSRSSNSEGQREAEARDETDWGWPRQGDQGEARSAGVEARQ